MRIGIDIDDTVASTEDVLLDAALLYDREVMGNKGIINPDAFLIEDRFSWSKDVKTEFLRYSVKKFFMDLGLKKGAVEIINKLASEGHEIYFVTYRTDEIFGDAYDFCYKWLNKNNFYFDKIIVNRGDKGNVCREEKIDLLIDDRVRNCEDAIKNGADAIVFASKYNSNTNIRRIDNWQEIYKIITGEMING